MQVCPNMNGERDMWCNPPTTTGLTIGGRNTDKMQVCPNMNSEQGGVQSTDDNGTCGNQVTHNLY